MMLTSKKTKLSLPSIHCNSSCSCKKCGCTSPSTCKKCDMCSKCCQCD